VIASDGSQYWHLNDDLHRDDGPAVIYSNGYKAWYLNGKQVDQEEAANLIDPTWIELAKALIERIQLFMKGWLRE